jgi:hypothetical protein
MRHVTPPLCCSSFRRLETDATLTADLFLCSRSFAPRISWPNSAVVCGDVAHFPFLYSLRSPTLAHAYHNGNSQEPLELSFLDRPVTPA